MPKDGELIVFSGHAVDQFRERSKADFSQASFGACCSVLRGMIYKGGVELGGQYGKDSRAIEVTSNVNGQKLVVILERAWYARTVLTKDFYDANMEARGHGG